MKFLLLASISMLWLCCPSRAYGVLTHEAIIDVAWEPVIVPILKQKYPKATPAQIDTARAYAYGGAITPDMGYFPFSNKLFSDLLHYVRTGDFARALVDSATNVYEYAYAIGYLAHYNADRYGHPLGVNTALPLVFPDLRAKHGASVTYEQEAIKHIRTEFGFDVLQTARGNYASDEYRRFISFEIADSLLKRAFKRNYDLDIDTLFTNFPRTVRTYRWAVKDIFPRLTRAAWRSKRSEIKQQRQTATARNFHYRMRRATFLKTYGRDIDRPGLGARFVAGLLRILPKVGPLKALKVAVPTPEAEKLFIRSFDTVSLHYRQALHTLKSGLQLPNIDFDTGEPSAPGEYRLADKTYFDLLMALQEKQYSGLSPELKRHILDFYSHSKTVESSIEDAEQQAKTEAALREVAAYKTQYR